MADPPRNPATDVGTPGGRPPRTPRWVKVFGLVALVVVVLVVIVLVVRGPGGHGPSRHTLGGTPPPASVMDGGHG